MAADRERELEPQDVILCLQVAGVDSQYSREGGVCEEGMCGPELGQAVGREGGFGGDVYRRAVETVRGWELHCEKKEEKELCFARAAVKIVSRGTHC